MSQLYTVRLAAQRLVTVYDAGGHKVSENLQLIPQVYHDLPLVTARAYERMFPDAGVKIELQAVDSRPQRSDFKYKSANDHHKGLSPERRQKVSARAAELIEEEQERRAAQSGDMAAAINAELS